MSRDYGFGDSTGFVTGPPRVIKQAEGVPECPQCRCATLYEIEVSVIDVPLLRGGRGVGRYVGCPACPFAGPLMMIAIPSN